jgi:hypothetical protein
MPDIIFTDEEMEFIKSRGWYNKNLSVSEVISASDSTIDVSRKLLDLYKKQVDNYDIMKQHDKGTDIGKKRADAKREIEQIEKELKLRDKLRKFLSNKDIDKKIQDVIDIY